MSSYGIKDKVAIVGMGCTKFGELWDKSTSDLAVDATTEALRSAGVDKDAIDAYWLGTFNSGWSGMTLAAAMKIDYKPVTRVENFCATGSEAFRNACYAVASGAYDVVMAVGVEKLKDTGYSGLTRANPPSDGTGTTLTAPAAFSMLAPAYTEKYSIARGDFKQAMTRAAWKNHYNGARNERAAFRTEVSEETIANSTRVAGDLGVFDCAGVSDGAAAAVIVRAEDARNYTDNPLYIKALSLTAGMGTGTTDPNYDYTSFEETVRCARDAYAQAGVTSPTDDIMMAEIHDCFTPTELVTMEDLGFSERGRTVHDTMDGRFLLSGDMPINPDGGLKSFGHPVGASGLRMLFECWLQLRGEAPAERQVAEKGKRYGMTHNLGGRPGECVAFVSLVGAELG
jgi:acetyl-CoA C-acetyltransferase